MFELFDTFGNSISVVISNFTALILILLIILQLLRIIWRVEKQLDIFFKLLVIGFILMLFNQVLRIMVNAGILTLGDWFDYVRNVSLLLFVLAFYRMNNLVTKLDKEK